MTAEQIFVSSQLKNVANDQDLRELPNALNALEILPEDEQTRVLANSDVKKARRGTGN